MIFSTIATVLLAACFAAQEITIPLIDLTHVVIRRRLREPVTASGSGDSVGYEGGRSPQPPLALELASLMKSNTDEAVLIAEFEIRNVSRNALDLPVDPSSLDVEPESATTPYRYLTAHIWLAAEPGVKQGMPNSELVLYGSRRVPATLRTLKPGAAVRIRAKVPVSRDFQSEQANVRPRIRAFLDLFENLITPEKSGLHSESHSALPMSISSLTVVEYPR